MRKLIYLPLVSLLLFSCGSEEKNTETKKEKAETNDSLTNDSITIEEKIEPRERLPKHTGSWIDRNLDNSFFYSKKVDEMVEKSKLKVSQEDIDMMDYSMDYITASQIKKLNTRELLYYSFAYPASFMQNCAVDMPDTTPHIPKISAYIAFDYDEESLSEIQYNEIKKRRDSVIAVLNNYIEENPDKIDLKYLNLLRSLDAVESFPSIIRTASEKNLNNYSFLLEFMQRNEFEPLKKTDFYETMYGEESYYYGNRVEATPAVRKTIIKLANQFYKNYNAN